MFIINVEYIYCFKSKWVIVLVMEYIKDDFGYFFIVCIMSEMVGISVMFMVGELFFNISGGVGVLLGGIFGVLSVKVVIFGVGIVVEYVICIVLGLGVEV